MPGWFDVSAPVGVGLTNNEDDMRRLDGALRTLDAYTPAAHHTEPVSYITRELDDGIKSFQEQNMLKVDGVVNPGGETARTIADKLGGKPRGADLLFAPAVAVKGTVGNWKANDEGDVVAVKKTLGGLGYMREHGLGAPHEYITKETSDAIENFQRDRGLVADGWLGPGGETETALNQAVGELARHMGESWRAFHRRKAEADGTVGWLPESAIGRDDDAPGVHLARWPTPVPPPGAPSRTIPSARPLLPGTTPIPPRSASGYRGPLSPPLPDSPAGYFLVPPNHAGGYTAPPPPKREDPVPPRRDRMLPGETPGEWTERHFAGITYDGETITYTPRPGDPLAIPLIATHRGGNLGNPETRETTAQLTKELMEACQTAMPGAKITQKGGPDPDAPQEHYREVRSSYVERTTKRRVQSGYSLIDGTILIEYDNLKIQFHQDTYTAKSNGSPIPREQRQFVKLEYNEKGQDFIVVRLPKPGLGEEIDTEGLKFAAAEICRRLRDAADKGELGDPKDPKKVVEVWKNLRKKRRAQDPSKGERKDKELDE